MTSRRLLSIPLALTGLLACGAAWAEVPFFNATCPTDLSIHADAGGPVYINGREAAIKRFSDTYFEASEPRSRVTLSITTNEDDVQLSYTGPDGRNGVCAVREEAPRQHTAPSITPIAQEVTCESRDERQTECDMDTHGEVRLVRTLSRTACVQNRTWGLYHHSVWVKDGCRAVFSSAGGGRPHGNRISSTGAGVNGDLLAACDARAGADGALLTRVPVNGDVTELIVD